MHINDLLLPTAAIITALTVIVVAVRKVGGFFRRMVHLFDEILGKESHDGLPASPGLSARIAAIEAEFKPNSGSSLRDQVDRLERWTIYHSANHDEHNKKYTIPTN